MANLNTVWLLFGLLKASTCFDWTSSGHLPDNQHMAMCPGQTVTLDWTYNSSPDEHAVNTEWRFRRPFESRETILATEINGHFFTENAADQSTEMEYIPSAGIRLHHVTQAASGTYSVHVNVNLHGSIVTHVQSVFLNVTEAPLTEDGSLQAHLQGARFLNTTNQHHLILICGNFDPLWVPQVSVLWTTPTNKTLPSTFYENGQFALAVPNPFISGRYSCEVDPQSPASACVATNSPLTAGAEVDVGGMEGRLALVDSELQAVKGHEASTDTQLQAMQTEDAELRKELQSLRENCSQSLVDASTGVGMDNVTDVLSLLTSRLDKLTGLRLRGPSPGQGRVELRIGSVWGTVCDDNWDVQDATVVCRQLGLPTSNVTALNEAHFGQGKEDQPILLDGTNCAGTEDNLIDCPADPIAQHNCAHTEDASVICA